MMFKSNFSFTCVCVYILSILSSNKSQRQCVNHKNEEKNLIHSVQIRLIRAGLLYKIILYKDYIIY